MSWPLFAAGAARAWNSSQLDEKILSRSLSRDVFSDATGKMASAALALGVAHRKFDYLESNVTPFGAVIAAPIPETRELFCRSGLKYYARIKRKNILAARAEVEKQRAVLARSKPKSPFGKILKQELDLAARMAVASCNIMLWQQTLAASDFSQARKLAKLGIVELKKIERDFDALWPLRNKATTAKSTPFLKWRMEDYRLGKLHFSPEQARVAKAKTYAAE